MSIKEALNAELKDAMRAKDQPRLNVIRQVETEISVARAAPGFKGTVDDALYLQVIAAYVKKMDKARQEYAGLGERGREQVQQLGYEITYLSRWLPTKLDEAQTRALVKQAIAELGVTDGKSIGRLVGHLMKSHKDELDGGLVNRVAREELGG
ncbi:MAG: GatB/YqeY domain-containing protein [Deltaproteobacteria bacterium]|nr:GatB/YqeY domain-containing protein [Deltaproteobacteria bacterium]